MTITTTCTTGTRKTRRDRYLLKIGLEQLFELVGVWEGYGHAEYPTIEPMDYREELTFSYNHKDPVFHYVQRTWKASEGSKVGDPIFWESGFLIDRNDGVFELVSAQKSGRMELLKGTATMKNETVVSLELTSESIINDHRMIRSSRHFDFSPGAISYQLKMSTHANPSFQIHLSAQLTKRL